MSNNNNGALAEYEKILEYSVADGLRANAYYSIGMMYESKNDMSNASLYYQQIIDEFPWLYWAQHAEKRINKIQ
jgi:tetratricopeptide (TPR) repeat protein